MKGLDQHEAECKIRWDNIETRLDRGSHRMIRLEALIWCVYPFILGAVFLSKDL